jgi:hypothetical protein
MTLQAKGTGRRLLQRRRRAQEMAFQRRNMQGRR